MSENFDRVLFDNGQEQITSVNGAITFTDANGSISTSQLALTGITQAMLTTLSGNTLVAAETFSTAALVNPTVTTIHSTGAATLNSLLVSGGTCSITGYDGLNYYLHLSGGTMTYIVH
jgi:hypothetical protein